MFNNPINVKQKGACNVILMGNRQILLEKEENETN